jgi:MFS family permease
MSVPAIPRSSGPWVVDGYNLALATLLLTGGRIGDRSGHKRVYLSGLAVFAVGTGLCAAAPSPGWLVVFRVLQGVGAAIELPAVIAFAGAALAAALISGDRPATARPAEPQAQVRSSDRSLA